MAYEFNPAVSARLALNAAMRQVHAQAQQRVDQMRADAVARSTARSALVQVGGAARNVLAGMLPMEGRPKVRRQLAKHVDAFTVVKALRADAKARVLG